MSSQSQGDSSGSSSNEHKRPNQGRRGVHTTKAHHGRSPQSTAGGKDDIAQKRIRNLQQKSHDKSTDYKLRPQTGRSEHSRELPKTTQRSSNTSGPAKSKGNPPHHKKAPESESVETKLKKTPKSGENGLHSKSSVSKDIKHSERKDSGIGCSPPSVEPHNELESTDTSVVDVSSVGPADSEVEEQEKVVRTENEEAGDSAETKKDTNPIRYTRDELLALRDSPASLEKHPALTDFSIDMPQSETDVKRKHPTTLSVIKEHDTRQLPKVSLSPQRKSFQSGCSWNDSKSQETPPSSARDLSHQFEFENTYQSSSRNNHGSFQQGPPPQSKHKVIDHIPLRDQEMGRGNKKNWREKSREKEPEWARDNHYNNTWEEEPEWMEFGPNDRFELIELKGLEEHEREREARLGREEAQPKPKSEDAEDPLPTESKDSATPSDKSGEGEDKKTEASELTESVVNVPDEPKRKEVMLKAALDMDNEFMLDGFDFSTGLSFFQGLDDEEDSKSPMDALRQVLKIGGEERPPTSATKDQTETILGMSSRPVNALTLDEIHARENIHTTPAEDLTSKPSSDDLGAFNKLVAGLQSSGALHSEVSKAEQYQAKPTHHTSTPSAISPIPMPTTSNTSTSVSVPIRPEPVQPSQPTFGTMLEKEMDFDEEVVTGAHPHYQPPPQNPPPQYPSRRVEHLERMLERLDHSHQNMFRDRHKAMPSEASVHMTGSYPDQPMKKVVPNHSVRMNPGQVEGQRPYMVDREYVYPEGMGGEMRMDMMPPPNIGIRPQSGVNRSSANNWAIEMERRRLYELNQMKQMERARAMDRMYGGSMHGGMQQKMPPPKPNISLLPTAVMRQMHNTKPNQSLSEVTKTSSVMTSRLDQEPSSKAPMTHSPISFTEPELPPPRLHPSHMYPMGGGQVRSVPPLRPVSDPSTAAMMYQRGYYNNMPVVPHGGMPNPYMY